MQQAKVLTVSERVAAGQAQDLSGPHLANVLDGRGFTVVEQGVVTDGVQPVADALLALSAGFNGLVVTTGGTGFGPADLTPEATRQVIEREAPGLAETMRRSHRLGALSRGVVGTRGRSLIVNLPGSPKGAAEHLEAVVDLVPHALELLAGHRPH